MSGVVINAETFGKRIKKLYDGWRVRHRPSYTLAASRARER